MDPLTAISLAGTVVQFLDFTIKIVAKSSEIYNSTQGATVRNIQLEATARQLTTLSTKLEERTQKACAFAVSDDELALRDLCNCCSRTGQELVYLLDKAKVHGNHSQWKSIRQALKEVIGKDRVSELSESLSRYREQIVIVLLVIAHTKNDLLVSDIARIDQSVKQAETTLVNENRQTKAQILDAIQSARYNAHNPQDVSLVSQMLSNMMNNMSHEQTKENVLNSLYYPRMTDRREWISVAHQKTFGWALQAKSKDHSSAPWDDLQLWLTQGAGLYWLTGKAGSGKSTLMKFIQQSELTTHYLTNWASPLPCVQSSFYFWNPGTSMQKSQAGLLQCLLFDILTKRPDLIGRILPPRWTTFGRYGSAKFDWTVSELLSILQQLTETDLRAKFCFFIDGLDEFDGNHEDLVRLLLQFTRSSHVKILASSRPWLVFLDAFTNCPKLMLQDLTRNDIQAFANDSLYNHAQFSRLIAIEPERAPQLIEEIVTKSSGVFLWVYLVVKSLAEGLTNADRISDLQRRLRMLPEDLEQYFLHILTGLDGFYLQQASQLFRLAIEAPRPLAVLTFSFLDEEEPDFAERRQISPMSMEEEFLRCEGIERRLNSRCKGLLESRRRQATDQYSDADGIVGPVIRYEVDFLHRTVRDFLITPTVQTRLVAADSEDWNANMVLARAYVAQLKALRAVTHTETNFQTMWDVIFDSLDHIGKVSDNAVNTAAKIRLLKELDGAAAHFRSLAIVKRRCSADSHWVNTGYRFGFRPEWNCDFLTLAIQYSFQYFVEFELLQSSDISRNGRPLLGFALTTASLQEDFNKPRVQHAGYDGANSQMVEVLLEKGANPNDLDGQYSVWVRLLNSLYYMACNPQESKKFYQDVPTWFEIVKGFLTHGANTDVTITVLDHPDLNTSKKLRISMEEKLRGKKSPQLGANYSVLSMIRLLFGGDATVDVAELEDLIDTSTENDGNSNSHVSAPNASHKTQSGYLTVPAIIVPTSGHKRDGSVASRTSQESALSWKRVTESDVVAPSEPLLQVVERPLETSKISKAKSQADVEDGGRRRSRFSGYLKKMVSR